MAGKSVAFRAPSPSGPLGPSLLGSSHAQSIQSASTLPKLWPYSWKTISDGDSALAVVLVHQGPDVTRERYGQVVRSMMGKDRAESPSDWPVEGLLVHAAGEGPSGFRVVDVWESEEAARQFGEKLAPQLQEAGITAEPEVYEAHAFLSN